MHHYKSLPWRLAATILAGLLCNHLHAAPLPTVDQNPLTAVYGLPLPQDARLPEPGSWSFTGSINISNTLNIDAAPDELLFVDGESHRINLVLDHGLNKNWSLRLLLPWIEHGPGFMDRPIDRYHQLLGLREGERPTQPRDRLLFAFQREGAQLLFLDSTQAGAGDLQLILSRRLYRTSQAAYSFSGGVKAPSGDSRKLTGSGATDAAFWASGYWRISSGVDGAASVGLLFPGEGAILPEYQVDQAAFGHAGLQWQAWPETELKLQLDWHTNFYENTESAFLSDVLQLSFGASRRLSAGTALDFAITEDIKVDASPDVNFNISLRQSYE